MRSAPTISQANRSTPFMMGVLITLVAALVLVGSYASYLGREAYGNIQHATDLLLNERGINSLLIDMETGTRGYLITGDKQFLQPYNDANSQLPALWSTLDQQISQLDEDATVKSNLQLLAGMVQSDAEHWKSDWADKEIAFRGSGQPSQTAQATSTEENLAGKELFDKVRESSQQLDSSLNDRLRSYSTDLDNIRKAEIGLVVGLGVLALAGGLLTLRTSRRETRLQDDVTRRIEAERQRLEAVVEHLPVGVRLTSVPDSHLILQNEMAEELFPASVWDRMTRPERIEYFQMSKPDGTLLTPAETPAAQAVAQGKAIRDFELSIVTRDKADGTAGGKHHLLVSAAPIRDEKGEITSVVVVTQDVTRMREIDQRKDEFIATAAHELRNPLAALSGYNQLTQRLVSRGTASGDIVEKNLGEISRQITRLNNLVERLLDASRIQLGRLVLDKSRQDLVKIAQTVVQELKATDGGAHTIEISASEETTGCWDAVRVEQVITNLMSNALRYTPSGSSVKLKIEKLDGEAKVEVIDRGPGIPAEQLPSLFDRYFQTTTTTPSSEMIGATNEVPAALRHRPSSSLRRQGLGLGLYISREIVKAHRGQIGVAPDPDGGSIFWFTLPLGDC